MIAPAFGVTSKSGSLRQKLQTKDPDTYHQNFERLHLKLSPLSKTKSNQQNLIYHCRNYSSWLDVHLLTLTFNESVMLVQLASFAHEGKTVTRPLESYKLPCKQTNVRFSRTR